MAAAAASSTKMRRASHVPQPAAKILEIEDIYDPETNLPDDQLLLAHFKREGRISPSACTRLIKDADAIFRKEPNVLEVPAPVTIVGDIHGQFFDLVKLFQVGGDPANTRYLFLGDYVDRGYFSLEVVLYLFALKIRRPGEFHMLRGNHECRHLTEYFTFKKEVAFKATDKVYDDCMNAFDALPIAAIMNKQFFCVHGGLSPEIFGVDDINALDRFVEPEESGPLCDMLWSDPHEDFDKDTGSIHFLHNETRGCSYVYTHKAACAFLDRNDLLSVIRAHEAQDAGYRMYKSNPRTQFPSVITIFSAPNYLDVYGNKAAVMIYSDNSMNIKKFSHSPHPYWLPNFMDVFTWSLPFIAEKTTEMLMHVMNVCTGDELAGAKDNSDLEALAEKMKNAMQHIGKQKEQLSGHTKAAMGALMLHGATSPTGDDVDMDKIKEKMSSFEGVKALDRDNEAKPTQEKVKKARKFRRQQTLDDLDL